MPRFRFLPLCVALAVTFTHFHCIVTSAKAAGVTARLIERVVYERAPRDLGSIPQCENETGCICRGAIFIAVPAVDLVDVTACQWLFEMTAPGNESFGAKLYEMDFAVFERQNFASPVSGRTLRALLGSFLI